MNEDKLNQLLLATQRLEEIQSQTERKIKDAQAYKENNNVLFKLLYSMILVFGITISITIIMIALTITDVTKCYFTYQTHMVEEIETVEEIVEAGDGGTIINNCNTEGSVYVE